MYYYDLAEAAAEAMTMETQTASPTSTQPQPNGMANGVSHVNGNGGPVEEHPSPPVSAAPVEGPTSPPTAAVQVTTQPPPPASQPQPQQQPQIQQTQSQPVQTGAYHTKPQPQQQALPQTQTQPQHQVHRPPPLSVPVPQPVHFKRQPSMPHGKVSIVEPPGTSRRASGNSHAFASPTRDHSRDNPKFAEDVSRLTYAIQQSVPEAVRRATRDHWEKTLLGTEFHQAFIMNAVIHHASGLIIRRGIRDFGLKMVSESKHELIAHFRAHDFDEVANEILEKVSDSFLDKALEKRLMTIDARSLINALARAERLGYENNDVSEDPKEAVPVPQYQPPPQPQYAPQAPVQQAPPAPAPSQHSRPIPQNWQCPLCWRKFTSAAPYEYHVKKQLCTKPPPNASGFPYSCSHCGAGFITNVGQQYHLANKVCGDHGTAPASPKGPDGPNSPIMVSPGANSPAIPQSTPHHAAVCQYPASQTPMSTPVQYQQDATPSSTQYSSVMSSDPYAHLTPITRARMNEDLRRAEESYAPRFKEAEAIADPAERQKRLEGLQNSFSTKQSNIRKRYGVRLRHRRTKEEIEAERVRMTGHSGGVPSLKRQRTDDGTSEQSYVSTQQPPVVSSQQASNAPTPMVIDSPSKHLPVSDMKSEGLGGSSATAALSDPTLNLTQQSPSRPTAARSLSSYQRNGHRVDIHIPKSAHQSPREQDAISAGSSSSTTAEQVIKAQSPLIQNQVVSPINQRTGSAADPIALDDEDDGSSDSDSDAEIPAILPRKASGTPKIGLAG